MTVLLLHSMMITPYYNGKLAHLNTYFNGIDGGYICPINEYTHGGSSFFGDQSKYFPSKNYDFKPGMVIVPFWNSRLMKFLPTGIIVAITVPDGPSFFTFGRQLKSRLTVLWSHDPENITQFML